MSNKLHCITTFFNPANFNSLRNNYYIFRDKLLKNSNIDLTTVELSFTGDFQLHGPHIIRLNANSVMWQKERLINYAISQLPYNVKYVAWVDCDILFIQQDWAEQAIKKLRENDIIQLFKKVYMLPKGEQHFNPSYSAQQGVIWQNKIYKNWLSRRKNKELHFSAPGFGWAARMDYLKKIGGIYDKNIVGSGDTFMVDCLLNSWEIHGYANKFTDGMKRDMSKYVQKVVDNKPRVDYIPVDILHLYHGAVENRKYMERHDIVKKYNFDPSTDIKLENNVFEWNSDKFGMHEEIRQYFFDRKEDL